MKHSYIGILLIILISLNIFIVSSCAISEEQREKLNREATQEGQVAREYEIYEHNKECNELECDYEYCDNYIGKEK